MINLDYKILNDFLEENKKFFLSASVRKIQQPSRQELVFTMRNFAENRRFYININPSCFHVCFMSEKSEKLRLIKFPKQPPMFCMLLRKYLENSHIVKVNQPEKERILELYFSSTNEIGEEILLCLAIELMGKHSNVILYNYDTNIIIGCMHNVGEDKSRWRELYGGLPYAYPPKNKEQSFIGLSDKKVGFANEFIDNFFSKIQYEKKLKSLKSSLLIKTESEIRKIGKALVKINSNQKSLEEVNLYRKKGDLVMSSLYGNKDFQKNILVFDYENNHDILIELDETKTLKENANKFYKLYNKGKTSIQKNAEIIERLQRDKEFLEEKRFFIENTNEYDVLLEIEDSDRPLLKDKSEKKCPVKEVKFNGFKIYIGQNSCQNDYIVSKLGRKEDYWFHVKDCAGSHVLLRIENGIVENDEILYQCAKFAKENSSAKNSSKVGVIYTKWKNIKKPPAAKLGYVTYSGEKEIIIN